MKKTRYQNQRIGVFVDVQNMYYSAKNIYNAKVNFKVVLKEAIARRKLIRAIAYVIKADVKDENTFYEALEDMGFEVKAKDLQVFYGGAKKGDWDVGIAMDVMRLAPKLDTIILVSGDGDFSDLLEHAKSLGCRVEVMAFGKTTSHKLIGAADSFKDLDKNNKYLLAKK
ncbi:MAG: NYN domain-containing protein [Candidatus Thermoplasmatota archaeon]